MSYNPLVPQPSDIPANSQDDFLINFSLINELYGIDHVPFGNSIETASLDVQCIMTSPNHRLKSDSSITVFSLDGINSLGVREAWPINGMTFDATLGELIIVDENTFILDVNSTNFPVYIEGSGDFLCNDSDYGYGLHKKVSFSRPQGIDPNSLNPISSLYTKTFTRKDFVPDFEELSSSELYFQSSPSSIEQITSIISKVTTFGKGFKTPFGITLNMGEFSLRGSLSKLIPLPFPYSTHLFTKASPIVEGFTTATIRTASVTTVLDSTIVVFESSVSTVRRASYISIGVTL